MTSIQDPTKSYMCFLNVLLLKNLCQTHLAYEGTHKMMAGGQRLMTSIQDPTKSYMCFLNVLLLKNLCQTHLAYEGTHKMMAGGQRLMTSIQDPTIPPSLTCVFLMFSCSKISARLTLLTRVPTR